MRQLFFCCDCLGVYADPVPEGGRNKHVNLLFCDTFRALPEQLQMSVLGIKPVNEMSFSSQLSHLLGGIGICSGN